MGHLTGSFILEMLMLYCISLLGFFIRKKGILNKHATDVLTPLTLYITLPALILFSLDIPFSFTLIHQIIWLVLMSVISMTLAILLAAWMKRRANLPKEQKVVYESITIFGNQGFIGYAVMYILFHNEGIIYLTFFNLFYLILIWTYGIFLFTKDAKAIDWTKIFLNPGIISTIGGIILLFSPVRFPIVIASTLENIGKMTIPLSMLIIGCLIADIDLNRVSSMLKNSYLWKSAFVKLLFIPCLLLPLYFFSAPYPLLVTAVIVSGMPSAPTVSLYAQRFGGDSYFASVGVLITTLFCIITIPSLSLIVQLLYK